ncbi:hypothetical protein M0R19_05125 [Candidatus Pacearchaeota archaeon]|jgi:hypothetical protein|nr:hypothetical protein [Candidatus Pacearchaeota archaeon]
MGKQLINVRVTASQQGIDAYYNIPVDKGVYVQVDNAYVGVRVYVHENDEGKVKVRVERSGGWYGGGYKTILEEIDEEPNLKEKKNVNT